MNKTSRLIAVYSLVSGCAMPLIWTVFFITGLVSGKDGNVQLGFLLFAEFLTAAVLLAAGIGSLRRSKWSRNAALAGLGMLLYAVIYASGHFFSLGIPVLAGFFAVLSVATAVVLSLAIVIRTGR